MLTYYSIYKENSMLDKKRILLHLPLELLQTDNGSKSKHISFLKYLTNRRDFLEIDVFYINYFDYRDLNKN